MDGKKIIYTMEQWQSDRIFKAEAGQEVEAEVYEQMLNAIPPLDLPRGKAQQALQDYGVPVHAGFLMGEPHSSNEKGLLYLAFGMNDYGKGKHYYYLGLSNEQPQIKAGYYYYFDCLGLLFNGGKTGLPDNFIPASIFKNEEEAVDFAIDHEATLYKIQVDDHGDQVESNIIFEPQY